MEKLSPAAVATPVTSKGSIAVVPTTHVTRSLTTSPTAISEDVYVPPVSLRSAGAC